VSGEGRKKKVDKQDKEWEREMRGTSTIANRRGGGLGWGEGGWEVK
jgi:hypothetical protein